MTVECVVSHSLTLINDVTVSSDLSLNPWVIYFIRRAPRALPAATDSSDSGTDQRTLHDQCRGGGRGRDRRQPADGRAAAAVVGGRPCGDQPEGASGLFADRDRRRGPRRRLPVAQPGRPRALSWLRRAAVRLQLAIRRGYSRDGRGRRGVLPGRRHL